METRFTAEMMIRFAAEQRGLAVEDLGVAPVAVLSWWPNIIRSLAETIGADRSEHWIYGERHALYTGTIGGQKVSFAHVPVGAPGTVMVMEEMIACGTRVFWGLGACGSLQTIAPIGTCLIPTTCIREEGTSLHYLPPEVEVRPSPRLLSIAEVVCRAEGVAYLTGPHWTTDAPYRETLAKIREYSGRGVLGVDMETSAMYAMGQIHGIDVCNLLAVSDELLHEWRPAFRTGALREALRSIERVILKCVAQEGVLPSS